MKKFNSIFLAVLFAMPVALTSCQLAGDIFKAGVWIGVLGVVALVALIVWLIGKV